MQDRAKRRFTYSFLICSATAIAIFLTNEVFSAKAERSALSEVDLPYSVPRFPKPTRAEDSVEVFRERNSFAELVTPISTDSPTPKATPHPFPEFLQFTDTAFYEALDSALRNPMYQRINSHIGEFRLFQEGVDSDDLALLIISPEPDRSPKNGESSSNSPIFVTVVKSDDRVYAGTRDGHTYLFPRDLFEPHVSKILNAVEKIEARNTAQFNKENGG